MLAIILLCAAGCTANKPYQVELMPAPEVYTSGTVNPFSGIERMADIAGGGRLWICWPKKASGRSTDVTQNDVRARGLAAGVVDFKICAVDAVWSGLCFTRRKA